MNELIWKENEILSEVSRAELNGLGGRVNSVEKEMVEVSTKVERNSTDIQKQFEIAEDIKKTVDRGKWQVLVMVAIPVLILIIQFILTTINKPNNQQRGVKGEYYNHRNNSSRGQ